jgi:hypothetical protein
VIEALKLREVMRDDRFALYEPISPAPSISTSVP